MTIKEILQRDPTKPLVNQGQARIPDKQDDLTLAELQAELGSFVCEGQFADGMIRIVESFLKNLGHTSQQAAWVSGFFGSGKSHFLKMLEHLWADTAFPDGSSARSLVPALPEDLQHALRELDTAGRRAGGLVAAAGSLPSGNTDLVRQTVLGIMLRGLGLPELYPQAQFCLWLREQGYFAAVKAEVESAGKDWDKELNNLYVSGVLARALLACDSRFASSEVEARKTIREQFPKRDTDVTTSEFLSVAKRALRHAGRDGRLPCAVLILDEAQQYIGDSNERSVLFTEVVEAVSKEMDSHVILVAAGQSALTGVRLLQKLMDRFTIRVPLSDTDVETVTRKVLLQKKPTSIADVRDTIERNGGEVSRHLQGTRIGEIATDRDTVVDDYPLLPVRRRFWEQCFRQIDAAGTSSQLRSQLRIIHDALAKLAEKPLGAVVTGDELFEALAPEMVNTGVLLREINERIIGLSKDWRSGSPLARRICGLVFLISKLPREGGADIGVRATKEHLADLLVSDVAGDNGKLRNDVEATLADLVAQGILMSVEDEFRLQTREGSEWDREFRTRQLRLANDEGDLQIKRDQLVYAEVDRVVRAQRVVQGAAKEARPLIIYRDQTPPPILGDSIPVWVRDGWSTSEKAFVDDARRAGGEDPVIYVFVPRASADDLRRWIVEAAAAEDTLSFKGVPVGPEGIEARRSIESRRDVAIRKRSELVRDIVGNAKVFQGGGSELLQITLDAKLREASEAALVRMFPRFREADSSAWGLVVKRAREGADQPFGPVGHSGPTEQHAVCQEVISRLGAGATGAELRKTLEASPYGWPRDAVDAALIALHRSQHLRATLNGTLVPAGQLDQNKISKTEFRVDSAPLQVRDRLIVRGLISSLVACKSGEEAARAQEFVAAFKLLAAAAGGSAPLPPPPGVAGVQEAEGLSGNELLGLLKDRADEWKPKVEEWKAIKTLVEQRRPAWEALERLAKHARDLQGAEQSFTQIEAIRTNRLLLAPVDPVSPVRAELNRLLRQQVGELDRQLQAAYANALSSLEANPTWQLLGADDRSAILVKTGLIEPPRTDVSTEDRIVEALERRPLSARAADVDAVIGRAQRALALAAQALEPTVRTLVIEKPTLRSEAEVRKWLAKVETQLLAAVASGPILIN